MTIASEITRINNNISAAYTVCNNKGAIMPVTQNSANLASCINTITSGSSANTDIPSYRIIDNKIRRNAYILTGNEFNNATSISDYGLAYSFYMFDGLTGTLNLSTITNVGKHGMEYTCYECLGLTGVDLSSLTDIDASGLHESFYHCKSLTSVNLSSVINVAQSGLAGVFSSCNDLTTIDVSSISSVGSSGMSSAFSGCSKLKTINLTSLTTIKSSALSSAFAYCTALTDVYFNALTTTSFGSYINQFSSLLSNTGTNVTHTLHFPSNLQSTISGLTGYPLFGGTSGYVVCAFDLPATS